MSLTLIASLVVQAACIVVLRHRLGSGWLQRPMVLLVLLAVLYHGVSEVALALPAVRLWDNYRAGIGQHYIDTATLVMSVALAALVAGYVIVARPQPTKGRVDLAPLDWRLAAAACLPLAILTYHGRGLNNGIATGTAGTLTELSVAFFLVLSVLAAFGFLHRHGMRWFVPVLAAQAVVMAAVGERTPAVATAVALVMILARAGMRPSRRQGVAVLVMVVLAVLGITGARAQTGRSLFTTNTSATARMAAIVGGLQGVVSPNASSGTTPGLVSELAARFDGNVFAGGIEQSVSAGTPRLNPMGIPESTLIAVPSAMYPAKLALPGLNPTNIELADFNMPPINFLPTFLGIYYGYLGPALLSLFMFGLGLLGGWAERRLFATVTPVRLAVIAAVVLAVTRYEAGLPAIVIGLRTAAVLAAVVWLVGIARASHAGFTARPSDRKVSRWQVRTAEQSLGPK